MGREYKLGLQAQDVSGDMYSSVLDTPVIFITSEAQRPGETRWHLKMWCVCVCGPDQETVEFMAALWCWY